MPEPVDLDQATTLAERVRTRHSERVGDRSSYLLAVATTTLIAEVRAAREEVADLRAIFDLQWTRTREADERWRAEAPEERAGVMPDLGVLIKWLMDRADQAEAHDRQPYPTADAYEAACRALAHYRSLADDATAALERSSINVVEAEQLRRRFEKPLRQQP